MSKELEQMSNAILGAILLGKVQELPPSDFDRWSLRLEILKSMDRLTATQILGLFPTPFLANPPKEIKALKVIESMQDFYKGVATWLVSFIYEGKTDATDALYATHWKLYEKFAILSNYRFQLISAFFNIERITEKESILNMLDYPSFLWLLSESAICRQMLANCGLAYKIPREKLRKDKLYKDTRLYLEQLRIPGEPFSRENIESLEELFNYFDRALEVECFDLAAKNCDFDANYYKPYMKARMQWNTECRTNKELQFVDVLDRPSYRQPNPKNMGKARKQNHK